MKFSTVASLAFGVLVSAQSTPDIPECAMDCYTKAIGETDCDATDLYCQCSGDAQMKIYSTALSCLCTSTCTTTDLLQVYQSSNDICSQALKAHGETFTTQPPSLGACSTGASSAATGGSSNTAGSSASETTGADSDDDSDSDSDSDTSAAGRASTPLAGTLGSVAAVFGVATVASAGFLFRLA